MDKMENVSVEVMSSDYTRAEKLNKHIKANAQIAQESLYEVCKGLKEMRDDKLYKELNYKNFEDYCEQEVGIKWRQAYNYISIAESFSEDFLQSIAKIGTTKLSLLAKLDEPQREEIQQTTDLESVTVRELKARIKKLETVNQQQAEQIQKHDDAVELADIEYHELEAQFREVKEERDNLFSDFLELRDECDKLKDESQNPVIDAVYTDKAEEIERLTASNEKLEAELRTIKAEYAEELEKVRSEAKTPAAIPDYKDSYRILIQNAKESVGKLKTFMKSHRAYENNYDYLHQVFLTLAGLEADLNGE